MKDYYHVLYTEDKNYFPHMVTSLYSLLENNKSSNFMIHIMESGYTKAEDKILEDIINLYSNCNIQVYDISKIFFPMRKFDLPKWRGTDMAYARLFFQKVIPNVSKLLYLDCDTTIVDSLDALFEKETSTPVAAVKEIVIPSHIKGKLDTYYNAGVLLFNYELWEKEACFDTIYKTLQNLDVALLFADQDLLNLSLNQKITLLNIKYNITPIIATTVQHPFIARKFYQDRPYFYSQKEIEEALQNPHILHNLSYLQARVWQQNKVHPFNSYYEDYRKLWDSHYQKEKNKNLLSNLSFAPFFNLALKTYASEDYYQKIKKLIKKGEKKT